MALVALLRGVNVGGHRSFRPTLLAERLAHLDVVNIGAAGTFVVRRAITQAKLRAEIERCLPFAADVVICEGRAVAALAERDFFVRRRVRADVVQFVSVLARRPRTAPRLPLDLPARGEWLVRILAHDGRFVIGLHRRRMKAIGCLGELDRLFGSRATTRSWSTIAAIARALGAEQPSRGA